MKSILGYVLEHGDDDLKFLETRQIQAQKQLPEKDRSEKPLRKMLRHVVDSEFIHMTYTEVIETLMRSKPYKKKKFKFPVEWGVDLQSEHERWRREARRWAGYCD